MGPELERLMLVYSVNPKKSQNSHSHPSAATKRPTMPLFFARFSLPKVLAIKADVEFMVERQSFSLQTVFSRLADCRTAHFSLANYCNTSASIAPNPETIYARLTEWFLDLCRPSVAQNLTFYLQPACSASMLHTHY